MWLHVIAVSSKELLFTTFRLASLRQSGLCRWPGVGAERGYAGQERGCWMGNQPAPLLHALQTLLRKVSRIFPSLGSHCMTSTQKPGVTLQRTATASAGSLHRFVRYLVHFYPF